MIYEIYKLGKPVRIENSLAGVSRYFKSKSVRGFSDKLIKKMFREGGDSVEKAGYSISKALVRNKTKADIRFRKAQYNTFTSDRSFTQSLHFDSDIILNESTKYDLVDTIIQKVTQLGQPYIQNHKLMVILTNAQGLKHSTKFLNFNSLLTDIKRVANYLIAQYHDAGSFNRVQIVGVKTGSVFQNVVFGSKILREDNTEDTPQDEKTDIFNNTWKSLKWVKRNMILTDKGQKKLFQLCEKFYIYKPSTFKCCLLQAVFTCKFLDAKKANQATKDYMRQFSEEEIVFTPDNILPSLAIAVKKTIVCHYADEDILKKIYPFNVDDDGSEEINIIVFGSHAHSLLPREACDRMADQMTDVSEIEKDKKKVMDLKNIQKAFEEAELNGNRIKRPKQRNPSCLKICTYDLETCDTTRDEQKKQDTTVYALGFYDGKTYKEMYKKDYDNVLEQFVHFLETYDESIILYAHNGGKFDTFLLLKQLLKMNDTGKVENLLDSGGRLMSLDFRFYKTKKVVQIRDSINLIPMSLDKACKSFKPKTVKLEGDVEHDRINIDNCTTQEIYEYTRNYLENDCVSLHEILLMFDSIMEDRFDFSIRDTLTNAGMARKVFLDRFYQDNLYNLSDDVDADLRKYYYGGRNEVMTKLGHTKGKLFYVDFTSLYPYVMMDNEYQFGKVEKILLGDTTKEFDKSWFGFVKCKFRHTHRNNVPLHAVVRDGKLVFAYIETWQEAILSTEEVRYSIENDIGYEYMFEFVYHYKEKGFIFKDIINELYKMKIEAQKQKNKALRQIAKIIINSTYGFFGINYNSRNQKVVIQETSDLNKNKTVIRSANQKREARFAEYLFSQRLKNYKQVNGYDVYDIEGNIKAGCANVGIASMVTSYARLELYKLLKDLKDRKGNIYYMDTDSVITDYNIYEDKEMRDKWVRSGGEKLGELTNETEEEGGFYTELVTLGNKMYALKNDDLKENQRIIKLKGINSKMKYDEKYIDEKKKTITFKKMNRFTGEHQLEFDDYMLLNQGYKLVVDNMNFVSGINEMVIKDRGLVKMKNEKVIRQLYDKAKVDHQSKLIQPLII